MIYVHFRQDDVCIVRYKQVMPDGGVYVCRCQMSKQAWQHVKANTPHVEYVSTPYGEKIQVK